MSEAKCKHYKADGIFRMDRAFFGDDDHYDDAETSEGNFTDRGTDSDEDNTFTMFFQSLASD
jgi:hypothetical protein